MEDPAHLGRRRHGLDIPCLAYDPAVDFARYSNGTVNHWNKLERPSVRIEKGRVVAVALAVIDVPKDQENGNDQHGSKVLVLPFDGAALTAT